MAIWIIRAGGDGEYEAKFLQEGRVYVTWHDLDVNLLQLQDREQLHQALSDRYPDAKPKRVLNWVSQVWPFAHEIQPGDLVILPLKSQRSIQIGEVTGGYQFAPEGPNPYFHWRSVKWLGEPIPRSHFGQDLLYSFGSSLTICRVRRNNAEARLAAMRASGWKPESIADQANLPQREPNAAPDPDLEIGPSEPVVGTNLDELAMDQIAKLIMARFKGHGLTKLVDAILRAQGYTTYPSPEGADGGADILAGAGPLGFGSPRLAVEVKSQSSPIDRPTVDKLLGAVTKFGAQEGLFVSWSGFRNNVQKELAASFFRVRLWTQKELLEALFANYDKLDEELKADLPLKRIWTVAAQDDS